VPSLAGAQPTDRGGLMVPPEARHPMPPASGPQPVAGCRCWPVVSKAPTSTD
jgi:hypothetical protein